MRPSPAMSMFSAAGCLGRPGMVIIFPARATTKPAPALIRRARTVRVKTLVRPAFCIVRKAVLRFGYAHRQAAEAQDPPALPGLAPPGGEGDICAAIDPLRDGQELFTQGRFTIIGIVGCYTVYYTALVRSMIFCAMSTPTGAALLPHPGQGHGNAARPADIFYPLDLRRGHFQIGSVPPPPAGKRSPAGS